MGPVKNLADKLRILLALAMLLATGCEDDDDDDSAPPDFGDNDPTIVVTMGDSITRGYGLDNPGTESYPSVLASLTGKTVVNAGEDAAQSSVGVNAISGLLASNSPGYVIVLYGVNDLIRSKDTATTIENLRSIVQTAKAASTVPILGNLPPAYEDYARFTVALDDLNTEIYSMASQENVTMVNLNAEFGSDRDLIQEDGLHPNADGAVVIAAAFSGHVDD